MRIVFLKAVSVSAVLLATRGIALAQEALVLPIVTVTVNKHAQKASETVASMIVFSREDLLDTGSENLRDLADLTPGLSFQSMGQSGLQPPVMRGLTGNVISYSSSAALVVDGVPTVRAQGFMQNMVGVERVEILRGPQSTLYGRSAEAGVINVITRKPGNTAHAEVSFDLGSRNKRALRFDVGHPLIADTLSIGLAGEFLRQDGLVDNRFSGQLEDDRQHESGRLTVRWTPGTKTDAIVRLQHHANRDGGSRWGAVVGERAVVASATESWNRSKVKTISLDVTHDMSSTLSLRSITAKKQTIDRIRQDTDFQPLDLFHLGRDFEFSTVSQEFRLNGSVGNNTWLLGLFTDRDDNQLDFEVKNLSGTMRPSASDEGSSVAMFTDWTIPLTASLSLGAGARFERSTKNFAAPMQTNLARRWSRFTPKVSLRYRWPNNTVLYATYAEGFRSGGFNAFAPAVFRQYEPEQLKSLEFGLKGSAANRRLSYSAATYFMNIKDMHVQQTEPAIGVAYINNAASARSIGLEAQMRYRFAAGWQLQAGLAINRTRFRQFRVAGQVYDGNHNPFAPDLEGQIGIRYDAAAGWFGHLQLLGTSQIYVDAANTRSRGRSGYGLVNVSAGHQWANLELTAYVRNLSNKQHDTVGFPLANAVSYGEPRELGVRLNWSFQ